MPKEENSVSGMMQLMLYKEMLDGMISEGLRQHALEQKMRQPVSMGSEDDIQIVDMPADEDIVLVEPDAKTGDGDRIVRVSPEPSGVTTGSSSTTTIDRFTWQKLFEHLSLDASEPFTETFMEQSRLLVRGNDLPASVAAASTLQDMTSCWAEYVAKLGLGTIDPSLSEAEMEEVLQKEIGGRKIGRSEKLLTLIYRRVGKTKKKITTGGRSQNADSSRKSRRGKRRKREKVTGEEELGPGSTAMDLIDTPDVNQERKVAAENDRLLQLAITESLASLGSPRPGEVIEQDNQDDIATSTMDDEPLAASLVSPQVFELHQQRMQSDSRHGFGNIEDDRMKTQPQTSNANDTSVAELAGEDDGTIIGSHKFAYSPVQLSKHIDRILEFWTGRREPVGVSIENTTRCGWCEFEDGCEWR